jgi:Ni/Co efflux regulator RcnB
MKKLALTVMAAVVATIGMASVASADSRNRGDDEWRRGNHHAERRDDNWRHGDRDRRWRHDGWRRHHHHAPRVVIRGHFRDDYCFVKKIRRYDDWGNVYIKRVRICR